MAKKKVAKKDKIEKKKVETFDLTYTGKAMRGFLGFVWKEGDTNPVPVTKKNAITDGIKALGFSVKE